MKIVFTVILFLVLALLFYFAWMGLFNTLKIEEKKMGPYTVVYEGFTGPYQDTGKIQDKIYYKLLKEEKIETHKGFGIYYDNPKVVEAEKLRSDVGCILEKKDLERTEELTQKGYQVKVLEAQKAVTTTFVYKNKLSILIGVLKVYPAVEKHLKEQGYQPVPSMEIYDVPNKQIIYVFEIKK